MILPRFVSFLIYFLTLLAVNADHSIASTDNSTLCDYQFEEQVGYLCTCSSTTYLEEFTDNLTTFADLYKIIEYNLRLFDAYNNGDTEFNYSSTIDVGGKKDVSGNSLGYYFPCVSGGSYDSLFEFTGEGELHVEVDFSDLLNETDEVLAFDQVIASNISATEVLGVEGVEVSIHYPLSIIMTFGDIDEAVVCCDDPDLESSAPPRVSVEFAIDVANASSYFVVYKDVAEGPVIDSINETLTSGSRDGREIGLKTNITKRFAKRQHKGSKSEDSVPLGLFYQGTITDSLITPLSRTDIKNITSISMSYGSDQISVNVGGIDYEQTLSIDLTGMTNVLFDIQVGTYGNQTAGTSDAFSFNSVGFTTTGEPVAFSPNYCTDSQCSTDYPAYSPTELPTESTTEEGSTDYPTYSPTELPTESTAEEELELPCFSALTTALVHGKGSVTMDAIKVGDKVLTGSGEFQVVYTVDHHDRNKSTKFVQIAYGSERDILEVTPKHMIFLAGKEQPVASGTVSVGDRVSTPEGYQIVTSIALVMRKGVFNPLTADGTIVASGLVASTFSALLHQNESITISGHAFMSYQHFFKSLMKPYRFFCTTMSLELCRSESDMNIASKLATRVFFFHNSKDSLYQRSLLSFVASLVLLMETIVLPLLCLSVPVGFVRLVTIWRNNQKRY